MKKRLMMGLLAGTLAAAMLPGVASADPGGIAAHPGERGENGAQFIVSVSCETEDGPLLVFSRGAQPAGIQGQAQKLLQGVLRELGLKCLPGTKTITTEKFEDPV